MSYDQGYIVSCSAALEWSFPVYTTASKAEVKVFTTLIRLK